MFLSLLAQRFAGTIDTLCAVIARHAGRHRAAASLVLVAYGRLRRVLTRLDRLAIGVQAGRIPRVWEGRTRTPRAQAVTTGGECHARSGPRINAGHAWLIRLAPEAAQLGPQVEQLVADPETLALVAAAPRAGRLLRPLCRMLGIVPPAALRLPPRPKRTGPAAPDGAAPVAATLMPNTLSGSNPVPWRPRVPGLPMPEPPACTRRGRPCGFPAPA